MLVYFCKFIIVFIVRLWFVAHCYSLAQVLSTTLTPLPIQYIYKFLGVTIRQQSSCIDVLGFAYRQTTRIFIIRIYSKLLSIVVYLIIKPFVVYNRICIINTIYIETIR